VHSLMTLRACRGRGSDVDAELLTVPEVMSRLRLSRAKIYDLIRSRDLETVTIGRCRRIPLEALTDYIARLRDRAA
jgi:excisionase family DNA binding protein